MEKALLLDGYIDTPGCLGVPPYISPLARYIYGVFQKNQRTCIYRTIDQFRTHQEVFSDIKLLIILSGVSVPGKYLGGTPLKYSEIFHIISSLPNAYKILCGPATNYGIGEEGGKPTIPIEKVCHMFDLVIFGDAEIALDRFLIAEKFVKESDLMDEMDIPHIHRISFDEIQQVAILGASIVQQHPNFSFEDGGNLVCEIETFTGCPRYKTGGCAFCIEPLKGKTIHRKIKNIIDEIKTLYLHGVRHFRLGSQTDFYAYQHGEFIQSRYPQPNVSAIQSLLEGINLQCPQIKTLHIDNVNALNFILYPEEAEQITKLIVKYCTPGNIAAIGVESVDPVVIQKNNLKATADEIYQAVSIINKYGQNRGNNGNPAFLPGLNFILGLPGESKQSLSLNSQFLSRILKDGLLLRRINIRKFMVSSTMPISENKKITKLLNKHQSLHYHWKDQIRHSIDIEMLKKVYPFGTRLTQVYAEKCEGNGTLLRQPGTYPITCFVPKKIPIKNYYDLVVVNHGFRSLSCLVYPIDLSHLSQKELESIDGIGKKRASTIQFESPKNISELKKILPELQDKIDILQSEVYFPTD